MSKTRLHYSRHMGIVVYIVFALIAAMAFAVSSLLKHGSAQGLPVAGADEFVRRRAVWRLVVGSVRHPLWLAGIAADTVALVFQVVALHLGPIGVVQPLLVLSLVIAFLLNRRGRLTVHHLTWPLAVVIALGALAVVAGSPVQAASADVLPAVVGVAITAVVIAFGLHLVGRPLRRLPPALVLGIGVGVIYAVTAALLKTLSNEAVQRGIVAVIGSWQLYALAVAGAAGLILNQAAFRAGPLHQSLPAISAVDPMVSIGIGVVVYDEHLRDGGVGLGVVVGVVVVLAVAIVRLSRLDSAAPPASGRLVLDAG